jgi:hypothetical protein
MGKEPFLNASVLFATMVCEGEGGVENRIWKASGTSEYVSDMKKYATSVANHRQMMSW